jgi:hypothetical protein
MGAISGGRADRMKVFASFCKKTDFLFFFEKKEPKCPPISAACSMTRPARAGSARLESLRDAKRLINLLYHTTRRA